jgi:hypothetical protein
MKAIILVWITLLVVIVLDVYLDTLPSPHPNW